MRIEAPPALAVRAPSSGFTLVELLLAVVIVAILAGLAAPSFSSFIADQRIKTVSFDLMSSLTLARSEAIKRNAAVGATVDMVPTGGAWSGGWTVTAPDGTVLGRGDAVQNVVIGCMSGGATAACGTVSYLGSGRLAAAAPSLQISSASTTTVHCVTINLSGQPSSTVGACP